MAKITFTMAVDGDEYPIAVGNEYEVAPGVFGVLKSPTAGLQDQVFSDLAERNDNEVCRLVLAGIEDVKDEDLIPGMPSLAAADFFTLVSKIGGLVSRISKRSDPSQSAGSQETQGS